MQVFNIMRMSVRFGLVFGLSGLLSIAIVAFTVVRLSQFADNLSAAPVDRSRAEGIRTAFAICTRLGVALLVGCVLTWWILRIAPFPKLG